MKKRLYNSSLAFFGGLFGYSILFILYYLANFIGFKNTLPPTFYGYLLWGSFNSILEEGTKFLLIKKWAIGIFPYGFFLGLGWGAVEMFYRTFNGRTIGYMSILLHILTAGIICYFIKKNKPILGLLLGIGLHTAYNLMVVYAFPEFLE